MIKTQFVTTTIALPSSPIALRQAIETEFEKVGKPLRWAITEVHPDRKTVTLEAIVTLDEPTVLSPKYQ